MWDKVIVEALSRPLPVEVVEWKPQAFSQDRQWAYMAPYVDARTVAARLDEAAPGEWEFSWELVRLDERRAFVKGRLTVFNVTREDAGEFMAAGGRDEFDVLKSAVSDALKRCAVLFGVGRDLYALPIQRVKWDENRRAPAPGEMDRLRALWKGQAKGATTESVEEEAGHWIDDERVRARFWKFASGLGLDRDGVHEALGVESVREFGGTMKEAADLLRKYAEAMR